jgi:hypothetical protein
MLFDASVIDAREDVRIVVAICRERSSIDVSNVVANDPRSCIDDDRLDPCGGCPRTPESDLDGPGRRRNEKYFFRRSPAIGVLGEGCAKYRNANNRVCC